MDDSRRLRRSQKKIPLNDFLIRYLIVPNDFRSLDVIKNNKPDIYENACVNRRLHKEKGVLDVNYHLIDMESGEMIVPIERLKSTSLISSENNLHLLDDFKQDHSFLEKIKEESKEKINVNQKNLIDIYAYDGNWFLVVYKAIKHKRFYINNKYLQNYPRITKRREYKIMNILTEKEKNN